MNQRSAGDQTPPNRRNRVHHVNLDPEQPLDHDTDLQAAMDAAEIEPGGLALVIGTRVGEADFVPLGYGLAPCMECDAQVWVNAKLAQNHAIKALCINQLKI